MLETHFIHELPQHLTSRNSYESGVMLSLFVVSFFLIAVARALEKNVFASLFRSVLFLKKTDEGRESYKLFSSASLLFSVQFVLITAGSVYWVFFLRTPVENLVQLLLPLFLPGLYFVYQLLMTNLATKVSGTNSSVQTLNYFTLLLTHFFGLVFLVELFVCYFQRTYGENAMGLLVVTYLIYILLRLLRSFWIVFTDGVPWYYIILYFWTLEILPLLVVAKLLFREEFNAWIG